MAESNSRSSQDFVFRSYDGLTSLGKQTLQPCPCCCFFGRGPAGSRERAGVRVYNHLKHLAIPRE